MDCGLSRSQAVDVIVQVMVSIKEATAKAIAFAEEALGPERTTGVRLEDVESTTVTGEDAWLITLSMIIPSAGSIVAALSGHR
jgi:CRISPR/Cas system CSM-associated protein Csm4 (group 5 of RAMP superfamily)